jgi:PilZ domain-containing protein
MPRLEKRAAKRAQMVVGVRLSGVNSKDSGAIVYTLDISASGAKLGGVHRRIVPGEIMVLHRHLAHVKCKVVWVREVAPGDSQIGVQLLDPASNFWGVELPKDQQQENELGKELWSLLTRNPAHVR